MNANLSFAHIPNAGAYHKQRRRMVELLQARQITDQRLLNAMAEIPRHLFVPDALAPNAYGDHALPIGQMQTISQPFMVALMTQLLEISPTDSILEIGTGSGYQTAILASLAHRVYAVERLTQLATSAQERLTQLGFNNATIGCFDGTLGWCEKAPFNAILIAAGGPQIPPPLIEQLRISGRLVAPIGTEKSQTLLRITRTRTGLVREAFGACQFVKLIGHHGWTL